MLTAAKLPAAAITVAAIGGAFLAASRTASAPSPPPMAMSGASGPSTTPSARVASDGEDDARRGRPARWLPPVLQPSAGSWPEVPGRKVIDRLTRTPASSQQGHRPPHRGPVESEAGRASTSSTRSADGRRAPGISRRQPRPARRRGRRAPGAGRSSSTSAAPSGSRVGAAGPTATGGVARVTHRRASRFRRLPLHEEGHDQQDGQSSEDDDVEHGPPPPVRTARD